MVKLHRDALAIFKAALKAADPVEAVSRFFHLAGNRLTVAKHRYDLAKFDRIFVLGAGKASATMAVPIERALGARITAGWINVKYGHTAKLKRIRLHECGHPMPDEPGVEGARKILELATQATARDLILYLGSGGGSALTPSPAAPITLAEKQAVTKLLLACGANIHEINTVRKHISTFKGGQLARAAAPATVIALLLSDVIGDSLESIGSGPTAPDPTTFADAQRILNGYEMWDKLPASVRAHLTEAAGETPKSGDSIFDRVQNVVVGSNTLAVNAAAKHAASLGYRTLVLSTSIEGETREAARFHAAIAREIRAAQRPLREPACIISGGETTVTIHGDGLGGRNQEFSLAAAIDLAGMKDIAILSGGTDGTDGPTDAAGAISDGESVARAKAKGLIASDYLARNDSYRFFDPLGGLIKTGPTGTNVMDVRLLLLASQPVARDGGSRPKRRSEKRPTRGSKT